MARIPIWPASLCSLSLVASLASTPPSPAPADSSPLPPLPTFSLWDLSFNLRMAAGYQDNVLLSSFRPDGSPFILSGLDAFLFRIPTGGTECNVVFSGEDRRYLDAAGAEYDQMFFTSAQVKQAIGDHWSLGFTFQHFYLNDLLDASTTELDLGVVRAVGHNLLGRLTVSRQLATALWLDVELPGSRQVYEEPLDDSWEYGPRLALRHGYGQRSELSASAQLYQRPYDSRTQADALGASLPDSHLEFTVQRYETSWRHAWGQTHRWRSTLRAGAELNRDNGSGYFDYDRVMGSHQLRFQGGKWELRAQAGVSYYLYDLQTASPPDLTARYKTLITVNLHAERSLTKRLKAFADYEFERSLANVLGDAYRVNTVYAGFEVEF